MSLSRPGLADLLIFHVIKIALVTAVCWHFLIVILAVAVADLPTL